MAIKEIHFNNNEYSQIWLDGVKIWEKLSGSGGSTGGSGDSGGIVYALTKSTNTRYTVGINLGRIEVNGTIYGGCIKAYMINQTFGLTRY